MEITNKYIAKIIDNNDTDQEGKCQIYIEELHHDLNVDQYPWARQDREWTSFIPEKDDLVWVYFVEDRYHKKAYYCNKLTLKEYHIHNQTIGSITAAYPHVKYIKLANGNAIAMSSDSDTSEISVYHSSGAEIYINNDGEIHIKGSGGTLEFSTLGETLKQMISDMLDAIIAHTHGTGVGPSGPPANATDFTNLKTTDLETILSEKVKNS